MMDRTKWNQRTPTSWIAVTALLVFACFWVACGGGAGSANSSSWKKAIAPPKLTVLSPPVGPTTGGTPVAITGTDIQMGATVVFGNVPAAQINSVTSTSIEAVTPVHDPANVDVTVTNPDTGSDALLGAFTFEGSPLPIGGPAPTISSVSPNSGPVVGGMVVTITGTGFQSGATVTFGQSPAAAVVFSSATQLLATTPAHASGVADVTVRNPDGQSATLPGVFVFTSGTVTAGCGTDCGNVGDPYEGGSYPAHTDVSACGTLTPTGSPTYYQLTGDIGSDPTVLCLNVYYPSGSLSLDLAGHTVTGQVKIQGNQNLSGSTVLNGTIACDTTGYTLTGCLVIDGTNLTSQIRAHHLTLNQTNPQASLYANFAATSDYWGGGSGLGRGVRLDHITSTTASKPDANRTYLIRTGGNSSPTSVHMSFEADHNNLTCSADTNTCQAIAFLLSKNVVAHHNLINMVQRTTAATHGRGILCDGVGKESVLTGCEVYDNDIYANNNWAVTVRESEVACEYDNVQIHDNYIHNIRATSYGAAIFLGGNTGLTGDGMTGCLGNYVNTNVYNNTLEMNDGNAVSVDAIHGPVIRNNTVTCTTDCSSAGWFAQTIEGYAGAVFLSGTDMTVKDNDVSVLTAAGKNAVKVCGPAGNPSYVCNEPAATTSATVCNTGTVVGNGQITTNNPPCP
jgi:hypothetical protein